MLSIDRSLIIDTPYVALPVLLRVLPLYMDETFYMHPTGRMAGKDWPLQGNNFYMVFFNIKNLKESVFFNFA